MSSGLNGDAPSMSLAGMGASNSAQIGTVTAGETARIPVREGAQYGEGVAGGELRENLYELPKRNHRPRHDDGQRDGYKLEEGSAHVPDVEHGPNDRVEGRDAASSRRVPSHDGLCGNGNYNERTDK